MKRVYKKYIYILNIQRKYKKTKIVKQRTYKYRATISNRNQNKELQDKAR
jgi:hypothetical protein